MNPRLFLGLFQRRECLLPTGRGWLALLLALALTSVMIVRGGYGFLAVQDSVPGGLLVVEGWVPDYALRAALQEFRGHPYRGIFLTGAPIEHGENLSEYKTFAELNAAILVQLGLDPQSLQAVPSPKAKQDRTYASAVALRDWLQVHQVSAERLNVVSLGAHSRRTQLLYEKAFGPKTRVGVIAVPHQDFEPASWWTSSQGFRIMISEVVAYLYARCLFHP